MKLIDQLAVNPAFADEGSVVAVSSANDRLAAIVDSSDDAIISKSLEGEITTWNKSAERIFGYTADEAIGCNITMLIPLERINEEPLILRRLRSGERVDHFDTVRVAKSGERLDISLTISPIRNAEGVIVGVSKIARDITASKHLYAELYDAQQLAKTSAESANRAKDRFIAVLSHELRTPLNPALLALVELEHDSALSDEQAWLVAMVRRNVDLELRLIDDLLDLTSIVNGKVKMVLETIDLHQQIAHVVQICDGDIQAKQQKLGMDMLAKHSLIRGDPARIQQILWNLLRNAVKFSPIGGTISIGTRDAEHGNVEVMMRDSGIGIDGEFLPRIFQAFEQDRGMTHRLGGLGLGLSISRSLTELHGGTLVAQSEGRGKGATFLLQLRTAA
jgi:PAS domain S-box-containing protein